MGKGNDKLKMRNEKLERGMPNNECRISNVKFDKGPEPGNWRPLQHGTCNCLLLQKLFSFFHRRHPANLFLPKQLIPVQGDQFIQSIAQDLRQIDQHI